MTLINLNTKIYRGEKKKLSKEERKVAKKKESIKKRYKNQKRN